MNAFRLVAIVALIAILASLTFGQELPGPQLPPEVKNLNAKGYQLWAESRNRNQYEQAARNVIPGERINVHTRGSTTHTQGGNLFYNSYSGCAGYYTTPIQTYTSETATTRAYEIGRYGGGPVWIVNPFVKP